ncbi:hypothetical protein B0T10DRAFT_363704, partial [Thelonectria olida]
MATQLVRFEFYCNETKTLTYTHEIPSSLIRNAGSAGATAEYNDLFIGTITPIMKEHEKVCRNACGNVSCDGCESPAGMVSQSPKSWLHLKPFIGVRVTPFCGR